MPNDSENMTIDSHRLQAPRIPNDIQCALIQRALTATEGNVKQAARQLGCDPTNLRRRMRRLGIDWQRYRRAGLAA